MYAIFLASFGLGNAKYQSLFDLMLNRLYSSVSFRWQSNQKSSDDVMIERDMCKITGNNPQESASRVHNTNNVLCIWGQWAQVTEAFLRNMVLND